MTLVGEVSSSSIPTMSSIMHKRLGTQVNKQEELFIHHFTLHIHELSFSGLTVNYGDSMSNEEGGDGELVHVVRVMLNSKSVMLYLTIFSY